MKQNFAKLTISDGQYMYFIHKNHRLTVESRYSEKVRPKLRNVGF